MPSKKQLELLYLRTADEIAQLIHNRTFRAGERLPSLRRLAAERKISIATALAAYAKLESDGLIEIGAKSGHFVRRQCDQLPIRPRQRLHAAPSRVSVSSGIIAVIAAMSDRAVVPLGGALIAPEYLPLRALNRSLAGLARASLCGATYDGPRGPVALRQQLAKRSLRWQLSIDEDQFVTTVGAMEAIHLSLSAVTRPGDAVAVESPAYFGLLQAIEHLGLRAVEIPAHAERGMDLDLLQRALRATPIRACVASPNFMNPLGALMSDEDKQRLVALLTRHDVPLIEDDVYGELAHDGSRPMPAKAFDRHGTVLLCGSVSKTLAPGYRVGWVVPGRYQDKVESLKFSHTVGNATLPQLAVAEYFESGRYDRHVRKLRSNFARGVQRFRDAVVLSFPRGTRISTPRGGFALWVEMPRGVDAYTLQADALRHQIAIAPGPLFSARRGFRNCIRISCGYPFSPRASAAITRLGELAAAQLG
jgi:DNA-binding transcriptional MocR family regulator